MSRQTNDDDSIKGFISKNLFTIIIGAVIIYSNFQSANSTTTTEVTQIKGDVVRIEAKLDRLIERGMK